MTVIITKKNESGEGVKKSNPHMALTHTELQGGAASGRNVALLMKSGVELDDESKALLKSVLGVDKVPEEIEKASYNTIRTALQEKLREKSSGVNNYSWVYVEDFDDEHVVYTKDEGVFYSTYAVEGATVSLGTEEIEANRVVSYRANDGELLMSDNIDGVELAPKGVYGLIVKSFDSISKNEKIKELFKSKHENEVKNVEQEILKALAPVQADLAKAKEDLTKAVAERDAFKASLEAIEKAQKDALSAERLEVIKSVVGDVEAEALHKSLDALDKDAFDVVLKSLKAKAGIVEKSNLFQKLSNTGEEVKAASAEDLLKAKYAQAAK